MTRRYEALRSDPPPKGWFAFSPGYDTLAYEAAYEAGEDYSFLNFVGVAGDGMGPRIDLRKPGFISPCRSTCCKATKTWPHRHKNVRARERKSGAYIH